MTFVTDSELLPPVHNGITLENTPAAPPATIIVMLSGELTTALITSASRSKLSESLNDPLCALRLESIL